VLFLVSLAIFAEEAQLPGNFASRIKQRNLSPAEMLREFEGPQQQGYIFGEGDEIVLEVWGRPELSGKHVIGPDGFITLPLAGHIKIVNRSRDEAVDLVQKALQPYYPETTVTLRVEKYTANRIFILGRVSHPGVLQFETTPTLLEAITRAGSLPVGGVGADKAALNRCAVFRGDDRVVWVDLKALLIEGNLAYNLKLRRNDVVYIPDSDDQLIYVLGSAERPGAFRLTPDMTLLDALAQAGGANRDADENRIHIIRPSQGFNHQFSMKSLLNPEPGLNFSLEEGDILYIPRRGMTSIGYIMQSLSPLSSMLFVGSALMR
jgi:polysaccharide export outer membrane protein